MIFTELMVMPDEKLISWLKDPENQAFARFSLVTELKNAIKENSYDLANTFVRVDSEILKFFANDLRNFFLTNASEEELQYFLGAATNSLIYEVTSPLSLANGDEISQKFKVLESLGLDVFKGFVLWAASKKAHGRIRISIVFLKQS